MQALSLTLRAVTSSKSRQFGRQKARFEEGRLSLQHLLDCEPEGLKRLQAIRKVYKDVPMMAQVDDSQTTFMTNVDRFLIQAKRDPSISSIQLAHWERRLLGLMDAQLIRYSYATLYISIMEEWQKSSDQSGEPAEGIIEVDDSSSTMKQHRQKWESYVFTTVEADKDAIAKWLDIHFRSSPSTIQALDGLKKQVAIFETQMAEDHEHFTTSTMNWCIWGLLRSDLLTDDKRATLTAIQQDKDAPSDVVDELNMRMNTLDRWAWPSDGVKAEQRCQVGSKYRIFHDEEILDALLLRYIGVKWSVKMCRSLTAFAKSTWMAPTNLMNTGEWERRAYYLGTGERQPCGVNGERLTTYASEYFLTQLLKEEHEVDRGYGDFDDRDDNEDEGLKIRKSAAEQKHSLLQLLITEITVTKRLQDEAMVLQSDFQSFGPSIPHRTIMTVLEFFGVSQAWIQFFLRALQVPIVFPEDGPKAKVRFQQRGTSMSSPLADVFGEMLLFCMDFSVWQRTGGSRLYRLHDDFWL